MTPRQLQKLIHEIGLTTNTVKVPGTDYYTIITDLAERGPISTKNAIDKINKLSFWIRLNERDKNLSSEATWVGDLYIHQMIDKSKNIIFASYLYNSQSQVLTITIYEK